MLARVSLYVVLVLFFFFFHNVPFSPRLSEVEVQALTPARRIGYIRVLYKVLLHTKKFTRTEIAIHSRFFSHRHSRLL